ncbi:MAG: flagellin, partial [Archaeoglobaceae archaeon]
VAAVFSYVMLGAGFFTTQKSKQVVDTGVKQASSSLTLDGQYIYLRASPTGSDGNATKIFFYVTQTAGGSPVDLEKTSIAITTASGYKQVFYNETNPSVWWSYESVVGDNDNVVEMNEKYKITINVTAPGWITDIKDIKPNDVITIEVRPPIGAPLSITKQLPPSFTNLTYV